MSTRTFTLDEAKAELRTLVDGMACCCALNPMVGGPVPCQTCRARVAMGAIEAALLAAKPQEPLVSSKAEAKTCDGFGCDCCNGTNEITVCNPCYEAGCRFGVPCRLNPATAGEAPLSMAERLYRMDDGIRALAERYSLGDFRAIGDAFAALDAQLATRDTQNAALMFMAKSGWGTARLLAIQYNAAASERAADEALAVLGAPVARPLDRAEHGAESQTGGAER